MQNTGWYSCFKLQCLLAGESTEGAHTSYRPASPRTPADARRGLPPVLIQMDEQPPH